MHDRVSLTPDRVPSQSQPAGQRSLDVMLLAGLWRQIQPQPAVEGERYSHILDDQTNEIEARTHSDFSNP